MDLRQRIEDAYAKSGNTLGWRLLYSPSSVLDGAEVAFLGLTPGGSVRPADQAEFSMPSGSAYVLETWKPSCGPGKSPLQIQVRALFERLSVAPDRVLAGNLVPFRSPNWESLRNRDSSLQFGEKLWRDILKRARPRLVIGMGREVIKPISRILGANACDFDRIPVGWGNVSATRLRFTDRFLIGLPHLSRFGIITRDGCQSALKSLFGNWRSA